MSKIGRKPIDVGSVQVNIEGNKVIYKGKKTSGEYVLPSELKVTLNDKFLKIDPIVTDGSVNNIWGLHRALLYNKIKGSEQPFEKQIKINGLGFKAAAAGSKITFSLGFSHKIDYILPKDVTIEIDKSGQLLTLRSSDKEALGFACSQIKALRPTEPYKGTGIQYVGETILRKAGKTKSA